MAALGIDFGTSNTAAGVMAAGRPHLITVEPGRTTLPTSVFFDYDRKVTTYGSVANTALIDGREGRFMRALKSVLGTTLMHLSKLSRGSCKRSVNAQRPKQARPMTSLCQAVRCSSTRPTPSATRKPRSIYARRI